MLHMYDLGYSWCTLSILVHTTVSVEDINKSYARRYDWRLLGFEYKPKRTIGNRVILPVGDACSAHARKAGTNSVTNHASFSVKK